MIKPRPTSHISAEPFGLFTFTTVREWNPRAEAHCPCGTRLSRYRPIGDIFCAPCQQARQVIPDELHPTILVGNSRTGICPECGGLMHRRAKTCRPCHSKLRKAQP